VSTAPLLQTHPSQHLSHPPSPPSNHRWQGDNGPRQTDLEGTTNLIKATPKGVQRFVLVTSAGVERPSQFPWIILNAFGAQRCRC